MHDPVYLLQSLVNGLSVGLIYGLVGIGFSVIYNSSGIVNFAQGVFVMLGGMVSHALVVRLRWPLALAALTTVLLVALLGVSLEGLIVRPMTKRKVPLYGIILATLAWQVMGEHITIRTAGEHAR